MKRINDLIDQIMDDFISEKIITERQTNSTTHAVFSLYHSQNVKRINDLTDQIMDDFIFEIIITERPTNQRITNRPTD